MSRAVGQSAECTSTRRQEDMVEITWVTYNVVKQVAERYVSHTASARYRLIIPMDALGRMGYRVNLLHLKPHHQIDEVAPRVRGDVVILSKLMSSDLSVFDSNAKLTLDLIHAAKTSGRKIIADFSDDHFERAHYGEYYRTLVNEADLNVASTPKLAEVLRRYTTRPVYVSGDPFEGSKGAARFDPPPRKPASLLGSVWRNLARRSRSSMPLRLLWFGHGTNLGSIVELLPELHALVTRCDVALHLVTAPKAGIEQMCIRFNEDYAPSFQLRFSPWSADMTWRALRDCDLVIIPIQNDDPRKAVKSPNRLIEGLWAGRLVIANPIPSYEEFGAFAWLDDSIVSGIGWALDHPREVMRRIAAGQSYIEKNYSPEAIAQDWDAAIQAALNAAPGSSAGSPPLKLNLGCESG